MKKNIVQFVLLAQAMMLFFVSSAFAEGTVSTGIDFKAMQSGLAAVAAFACAIAQGKLVSSMLESIGRNPSAAGKMNVPFFVGLAFIESLLILVLFA